MSQEFVLEQWTESDYKKLQAYVLSVSEESYAAFQSKIVPGIDGILGVRVPVLRKIAKQIAKGNGKSFLQILRYESYEEAMLAGMVLGYTKEEQLAGGLEELLEEVDHFLPHIDNWAVCDIFCSGFKITKKYKKEIRAYIDRLLISDDVFTIRVGYVLLLDYYLGDEDLPETLMACARYEGSEYYVNMAISWLLSMAYVWNRELTVTFLTQAELSDEVYNKALQKIIESKQVTEEDRNWCRKQKR